MNIILSDYYSEQTHPLCCDVWIDDYPKIQLTFHREPTEEEIAWTINNLINTINISIDISASMREEM